MPRKQRAAKLRRLDYNDHDRRFLIVGTGWHATMGTINWNDRLAVKQAWNAFQDEIMSDWTADPEHAGSRPAGWWLSRGLPEPIEQAPVLRQLGELTAQEEKQIAKNRAELVASCERSLKRSALQDGPGPWARYDLPTLRKAWKEYGKDVMKNWLSRPHLAGKRPWAYWVFEKGMEHPPANQEAVLRELNELTPEEEATLWQRKEQNNGNGQENIH